MRSAATNGPRDHPRDHGDTGKGGEDRYGSRQLSRRLPYRAPLILAKNGQSPLAPAGLSQRSSERAMRLAAVPRASRAAGSRGLNPAQPSRGRQCHQPGRRNGKANAADDDQLSA